MEGLTKVSRKKSSFFSRRNPPDIGQEPKPYVKNHWIIGLYGCLLLEFGLDTVREYWRNLPLEIEGRLFSEYEMFQHFWDTHGETPQIFICNALLAIEPFFISKGRCFPEKWEEYIRTGIMFEPRWFLWFISPFSRLLSQAVDIKTVLFHLLPLFSNFSTCPHAYAEILRVESYASGGSEAINAFTLDRFFNHLLPNPDLDTTFAIFLHNIPVFLGLTPYDGHQILAECQSVLERVRYFEEPSLNNGIFFIKGIRYGYSLKLSEFMARHALFLKGMTPPDKDVIFIERDYICPERKRIILHKEAIYGSPIYMLRLINRKPDKTSNPFKYLSTQIAFPGKTVWKTIEKLHYELMDKVRDKVNFHYDIKREIIFVNQKPITSGIQARLLRKIILLHIAEKRTEFERREFTADASLVSDFLDTGFAVRLKRIADALQKINPPVRITHHSRGRFRLETNARIEYQET